MTSYHGGKQKTGKKLADIIWIFSSIIELEQGIKFKGYCEPFCGMLGVYQHIPELFENNGQKLKYKAGDVNQSVIMMWKAAQKGWNPPKDCSEKEYEKLKLQKKPSAKKGFIGHQFAFAGRYFGGFSKKYGDFKTTNRAIDRIKNIASKFGKVYFSPGTYSQFSNLRGYIIYCDPPYENTTCHYLDESLKKLGFNHEKFWDWCRKMSKHNLVIISENTAPHDFIEIYSTSSQANYKGVKYKGMERLFVSEKFIYQ